MITGEIYLFKDRLLLSDFKFPQPYLDLINNGLPDIDPWWWLALHKDSSQYWAETLQKQFPSRSLIPFAKDGGSDDVACFDGSDISGNPKVFVLHSFCSPGWEGRYEPSSFTDWFKKTESEALEFKTAESSQK